MLNTHHTRRFLKQINSSGVVKVVERQKYSLYSFEVIITLDYLERCTQESNMLHHEVPREKLDHSGDNYIISCADFAIPISSSHGFCGVA